MLQTREDIVTAFNGRVPSRNLHYQPVQFQNGAFQVGFTEIGPLQVHSCHVALLQRREIPLVTSEPAARAHQR